MKGTICCGSALVLALIVSGTGWWQPARSSTVHFDPASRARNAAEQPATGSGFVRAIVELEGEPVSSRIKRRRSSLERRKIDFESEEARSYESQLATEQSVFVAQAQRVVPKVQIAAQLRLLANAVSLEAPRSQLDLIAALPGVRHVERTRTCHALLNRSVPLISAPALWGQLGGDAMAGRGIKIAIIDTGIDTGSLLLSDAGMTAPVGFPRGDPSFTNNKVIVAKAFLKKKQGTSPADEFGHGTAVAGVAAGALKTPSILGPISGVAPRAFLGNYRVLDAAGEGPDDLVAAGLEEAVRDGFDVANLSLGDTSNGELTFLDRTVEAAVAAGAVVVAAAGNEGQGFTLETIAEPAEAPSAITAAATSNSHSAILAGVTVTGPAPVPGDLQTLAAQLACCADTPISVGPLPCVDVAQLDPTHSGLQAGSLAGKIALIEQPITDFDFGTRVAAARNAGAAAAIFFVPGTGGLAVGLPSIGIPVFGVFPGNDGVALRDWVDGHPGTTVTLTALVEKEIESDVVSYFSSVGPSALGSLKPDVAAPGQSVFTAWPRSILGYMAVSGTSLSAPHVAGAAALIKQLHPLWTPEQIKSALMSSAVSVIENELKAGAGRIDVGWAGSVTATFSPPSISFGFRRLKPNRTPVPLTEDFSITNVTSGPATFTLSINQQPPYSIPVALSRTSLSLGPGENARVTLAISPISAEADNGYDFLGEVLVQGPGARTLHVPYWVRFGKVKNQS